MKRGLVALPEATKRGLIALAGAHYDELQQCPKWEQRKYEAFGMTVLVPAIFGMVAASYAVSTLTESNWIVFGFALIWGFIILAIDRALLTTYRAFSSPWKKLTQFLMRFCVAFLLGFTIAHPLTLLLFKDTIEAEVERKRLVEIEEIRDQGAANKKELENRITEVATALAEQQRKYEETITASFMEEKDPEVKPVVTDMTGKEALDEQIAQATQSQRERLAELDEQLNRFQQRYGEVQKELSTWQQTYEAEISGERSGSAGIGPRARSIEQDQLNPRREEVKRLSRLMENLTEQRNELSEEIASVGKRMRQEFAEANAEEAARIRADQQEVASLQRKLKKQQWSILVDQQDELLAQIQGQIDSHSEELKRLREEASQLSADTQGQVALVQQQRRADLLTQTLALHALFERGEEGGKFALAVYLILAALFMVVDTIPIVVKFFSNPGPYDLFLAMEEPGFLGSPRAGKVFGEVNDESKEKKLIDAFQKRAETVERAKVAVSLYRAGVFGEESGQPSLPGAPAQPGSTANVERAKVQVEDVTPPAKSGAGPPPGLPAADSARATATDPDREDAEERANGNDEASVKGGEASREERGPDNVVPFSASQPDREESESVEDSPEIPAGVGNFLKQNQVSPSPDGSADVSDTPAEAKASSAKPSSPPPTALPRQDRKPEKPITKPKISPSGDGNVKVAKHQRGVRGQVGLSKKRDDKDAKRG